jgi:hypothetical protein
MKFKQVLIKLHWLLSSQFGLDPRRFLNSLRGLPSYIADWRKFSESYQGKLVLMPCLQDRYEEGGATKSEYFWQDLLVARWIHEANPEKHVDVGSRVDGFVAHVASFREIEVFDVRPISTSIPGIVLRQADLMDADSLPQEVAGQGGYCDSLSCLHALEHFGLGRYGDPINPTGYRQGLQNMASLLQPGGLFYLSTPVGYERVEFNANWVFDPRTIVDEAKKHGLELKKLSLFSHTNGVQELEPSEMVLSQLANERYNLGIFTFSKYVE